MVARTVSRIVRGGRSRRSCAKVACGSPARAGRTVHANRPRDPPQRTARVDRPRALSARITCLGGPLRLAAWVVRLGRPCRLSGRAARADRPCGRIARIVRAVSTCTVHLDVALGKLEPPLAQTPPARCMRWGVPRWRLPWTIRVDCPRGPSSRMIFFQCPGSVGIFCFAVSASRARAPSTLKVIDVGAKCGPCVCLFLA